MKKGLLLLALLLQFSWVDLEVDSFYGQGGGLQFSGINTEEGSPRDDNDVQNEREPRSSGDEDRLYDCGGVRTQFNTNQHRGIDANHVLWDAGIVPFQYHESCFDTDIPLFEEAMEYIESVSCVRFEKRSGQSNYLEFARACHPNGTLISSCVDCLHIDDKCFHGSYVESLRGLGRGGRIRMVTGKFLQAGNLFSRGHMTHELLHVLGHQHTQNRPDRDNHVTIKQNGCSLPKAYNKCSTCDVKETDYDCMSIMHYRGSAGCMVALDPAACDLLSTAKWMRWADIDLLNANYQCQNAIPLVSGGGVLTSADTYPVSYSKNDWWVEYLVVAEGNRIEFNFVEDFEIYETGGSSCTRDGVRIVDGNGQDLLPKTCGTSKPSPVTSVTNRAFVDFSVYFNRPDSQGFKLQWREVENTGLNWKKVFYHDTSGGLFTGAADTLRNHPDDESSKLYSILDQMEEMRGEDGNFHLKLCYPEITDEAYPCNEWYQTSNPASDTTVTGYKPVKLAFPTSSINGAFGGLGVSPPSAAKTYIDDVPNHRYWWFAIGARQHYGGATTIPGPYPTPVTKVVLYVTVDVSEPACDWTDWGDRDDPTWTADYEMASKECVESGIVKYEVRLVSGGQVYDNVADITQNTLEYNAKTGVILCRNTNQVGCQTSSNGHAIGFPVLLPCCQDYKTRFCCKPPTPTTKVLVPVDVSEPACDWTDWGDRDDPTWTADWEMASKECVESGIVKYEVRLVSGGNVYENVADITQNILEYNEVTGVIACLNKNQVGCQTSSEGWPIDSPILLPCCQDYETRFCCKPISGKSRSRAEAETD